MRVPAQTLLLSPVAHYTDRTVLEIDSGPESRRFYLNGLNFSTPMRINASRFPITISAPEVQEGVYLTIGCRRPEHRYRFESWSDGGAIEQVVTAPPEGGRLALNTTPEYLLNAVIVSPWESVENPARIQVRPKSADGYYPAGEHNGPTTQRPDGIEATWAVC